MEQNTYKYILDELGKQNNINQIFNTSIDSIANAHNALIKNINKSNTCFCIAILGVTLIGIRQAKQITSLQLKVDELDEKLKHTKVDYGSYYSQGETGKIGD